MTLRHDQMPFEGDPLVGVDHKQQAEFAGIRYGRHNSTAVTHQLEVRGIKEDARNPYLNSILRMIAQLADPFEPLRSEALTSDAQTKYYLGEMLALDILDAIAFERRLSRAAYRDEILLEEAAATEYIPPEPKGDIDVIRQMITRSLIEQGLEALRSTDVAYQSLEETIRAKCYADSYLNEFSAGFGLLLSKGYRALGRVQEAAFDEQVSREMLTGSKFDQSLSELLS